jgi:hypothetical protein
MCGFEQKNVMANEIAGFGGEIAPMFDIDEFSRGSFKERKNKFLTLLLLHYQNSKESISRLS